MIIQNYNIILTINKFRNCRFVLVLLVLFVQRSVQAQDAHFSQFNATPIFTNPANTVMSDDNLRIANNYRNQWSRIGVPYKTLYTSLDTRITVANHVFGIGGGIVHDQSSGYSLTSNEFLLSLSYSKYINNNQITIGIQPGFGFKSYNMNGLTFGTQFDAASQVYNTSLPSSENSLGTSLRYFDFNMGINWRTLIRNIMPSAGISISHILKPAVTFSTTSQKEYLPMKLTFNGQVKIPFTSKLDLIPGFLYSSVPGSSELLIGGYEVYAIQDFFLPVKKLYAINMLRVNLFTNIDAVILGGGVRFAKFDLGISYDINVSPLSQASYFNGAFEISLVFTGGNRTGKVVNEPCFIY